ncbi:hypothetical protein C7S13_1430 [Burkholderia cepacia]|nr:hypothetical protein [Burkholderia cepacia]
MQAVGHRTHLLLTGRTAAARAASVDTDRAPIGRAAWRA